MINIFLKHKKWIGYISFGIIIFIALLYLLFPSDTLREYIQESVHNRNPDVSLRLNKVSLSFPFSMKLTGVECRIKGSSDETAFMAQKIIIRPKIWSLMGKKTQYDFSCDAYKGTITGKININKSNEDDRYSLSAELNNIHIDEDFPLSAFVTDYIEGTLNGTINYAGNNLFGTYGTGQASLILSDGSVKFTKPLLNMNVIDLEKTLIKVDLRDQNLNIQDLSLKGDDILGRISGVINLKDPLNKSRLNLKGEIELTAIKNGKLSFSYGGTIERPDLRLN